MRRNKLYTVNKGNQPAFMPEKKNLFSGLQLSPSQMQQLKAYNMSVGVGGIPLNLGLGALGSGGGNNAGTALIPSGGLFGAPTGVDTPLGLSKEVMGNLKAQTDAQLMNDYMNSKNFLGIAKKDNPFSKTNLQKAFSKDNLKAAGTGLATAGIGIAGNMIGNALSGGLSSKAGDVVGSVGSTVLGMAGTAIGGPLGGAIGSAVGSVLGGAVNGLFGESVDAAKLAEVNENIAKLNSFQSNASTFDEVKGPEAVSMDTDVYSGGLFNDVSDKNEELKRKLMAAKSFAERSVDNNIYNIADTQLNNALANYAAFGGKFNRFDIGGDMLNALTSNVDTRSDSTYQGYNPTPIRKNAGAMVGTNPISDLVGALDDVTSTTKNNPYIQTGIAPSPGRAANVAGALKSMVKPSFTKAVSNFKPTTQKNTNVLPIYAYGGNLFAGGGEANEYSTDYNPISDDYTPIISTDYQPLINTLKRDDTKFNVDDFAYRAKKLHPEVTREQVADVYNNTPFIAAGVQGDPTARAKYIEATDNNAGSRVMVYPNAIQADPGIGGNSKIENMRGVMAHDNNHLMFDQVLGGQHTDAEKQYMDAAYPDDVFSVRSNQDAYDEKRATNAQLRSSISRENNNATGKSLDKIIDKMSDNALMGHYMNQNGYLNKNKIRQSMKLPNGRWDTNKTKAIRESLKNVAFVPSDALDPTKVGLAALGGSLNKFAEGGLEAAFMDEFSSDPIGAAVRYNKGLEAREAEREARIAEAAKEEEYRGLQQRVANLETENQGLQALVAAMPTSTTSEAPASSPSPSRAAYASNWDYIEDQLKRSGKFNDVQIQGIKYNLQRESGIGRFDGGDNGTARGIAQWRGKRIPEDMSIEGQTRHLIDTLSTYDGKLHWIGEDNYNGFMHARTPEEAHYYIAKGYERPHQSVMAKVKRDSDMSLRNLNAFGGELGTNGTDFTNGLLYIDEGGSHESNPLEGVPMGLDPQGVPNLVEEGETVYNDYVFSDRLKVPFFMYKELGLGGVVKKKGKEMSFADASKKLAMESEKRPNDPISQAGLQASLSKLAEIQETERMRKNAKRYMGLEGYACGGKLGNKYANGRKLKKYDYYRNGSDGIGTPTGFKVKNNGVAYDYTDEYRKLVASKTADDIRAWAAAHPDDPSLKSFLARGNSLENLTDSQWRTGATDGKYGFMHHVAEEMSREPEPAPEISLTERAGDFEDTAPLPEQGLLVLDPRTLGNSEDKKPKKYDTWMRYAPAVGSGIMTLTDMLGLTNTPDYGMADKIEATANASMQAPKVSYNPVGNYLTYRPMDIWYEQNRMNANARATDRAIMNNAAPIGTKMAGLLASGYNDQIASGNLYRQALEYNDAQRERVEDFNRRTNMFNSQMGLEADMANARYRQAAQQLGLSGLGQAAALRNEIDARVGAARSANMTNFLNNLGNIGRENFAMNQINTDRSRSYYGDLTGDVSGYKGKKKSAFGGRLKRK